jgi:hypothetical protein
MRAASSCDESEVRIEEEVERRGRVLWGTDERNGASACSRPSHAA